MGHFCRKYTEMKTAFNFMRKHIRVTLLYYITILLYTSEWSYLHFEKLCFSVRPTVCAFQMSVNFNRSSSCASEQGFMEAEKWVSTHLYINLSIGPIYCMLSKFCAPCIFYYSCKNSTQSPQFHGS